MQPIIFMGNNYGSGLDRFFIALSVVFLPRFIARSLFHEHHTVGHISLSRYFGISLFMSLIIYFADTFVYAALRRSRFLAKLYYPIYLFWNKISMGFLWRPLFQLIFSNAKSKWKASLAIFGLLLIGLFFTGDNGEFLSLLDSRIYKTSAFEMNETSYAEKNSSAEWTRSTIQSEIINDNYLQVFVPYNDSDDYYLDSLKSSKKYFSDIIILSLDDSSLTNVKWIGINKTNLQKGIHTVISISSLKDGLHTLNIKRQFDKDSVQIPFWKE